MSQPRRRPRRDKGSAILRGAAAAVLALACSAPPAVAAPSGEEYQLKAAFLYNFARMVDWAPPQATLSLCVFGQDPFGRDVDALSGKPVGSARLQVRRVGLDQVAGCQVLFIANSEAGQLPQLLERTRGRPVLTVGDGPGVGERGAVINFYTDQNKVRFEINIDAARRSGLDISAQLLRLARIIHDRNAANG